MTVDAIALGSEYFAQSPHARFGTGMAEGHSTWSGRKLHPGDAVEPEIAPVVRRYTGPGKATKATPRRGAAA
jgi:hypothetical protein